MPARRIPDEELDAFAARHLRYEVAMLVAQAGEYARRYPAGGPGEDGFRCPAYDDALLESTLVHLRLLDEFLSSRGSHRCDVRANDWVSDDVWSPTDQWLSHAVRRRINWQVAHLSLCREGRVDWDLRSLAYACCTEFTHFLRAVKTHRPARMPALRGVLECAHEGMTKLRPT